MSGSGLIEPSLPPGKQFLAIHRVAGVESIEAFLYLGFDLRTCFFQKPSREFGLLIRRQPLNEPLTQQPLAFGLLQQAKTISQDLTGGMVSAPIHKPLDEPLQFRSDRHIHACSNCHIRSVARNPGCVKSWHRTRQGPPTVP